MNLALHRLWPVTKGDSLYYEVEAESQRQKAAMQKQPTEANCETRSACWFPPFSELSGACGHNSSAFDVLPHFVSDSTSEREKIALPFCFAFI